MKLKFKKEKETKNTIRYAEEDTEGQAPVLRTIYVQKWFAQNAPFLELTIKEDSE